MGQGAAFPPPGIDTAFNTMSSASPYQQPHCEKMLLSLLRKRFVRDEGPVFNVKTRHKGQWKKQSFSSGPVN